jgi:hypothetical protein
MTVHPVHYFSAHPPAYKVGVHLATGPLARGQLRGQLKWSLTSRICHELACVSFENIH